jgi:hypothetical protein
MSNSGKQQDIVVSIVALSVMENATHFQLGHPRC